MFLETKPDLPTPVMKIVPVEFKRVCVNTWACERSSLSKKLLRYFCWELKRVFSLIGSMRSACFSEGSEYNCGRDPILFLISCFTDTMGSAIGSPEKVSGEYGRVWTEE